VRGEGDLHLPANLLRVVDSMITEQPRDGERVRLESRISGTALTGDPVMSATAVLAERKRSFPHPSSVQYQSDSAAMILTLRWRLTASAVHRRSRARWGSKESDPLGLRARAEALDETGIAFSVGWVAWPMNQLRGGNTSDSTVRRRAQRAGVTCASTTNGGVCRLKRPCLPGCHHANATGDRLGRGERRC